MKGNLSHSRIQVFKQCRKRYEYHYRHRIRPDRTPTPFRVGSIGHAALETLMNGNDLNIVIQAIRDTYSGTDPEIPLDAWWYECEMLVGLVRGYHDRWGTSQYVPVACEVEFEIPIVNPATGEVSQDWGMTGKIDAIVADDFGRYGVMEHKFYSNDLGDSNPLWQRLEIDPQVTLYAHAARQVGYPVEYVVYDVIRKPDMRIATVPVLDEQGDKIVRDQHGNRVYNKNGKPRQTASTKHSYTLETMPIPAVEFGEKVYQRATKNPDSYYRRKPFSVLDDEIEAFMAETWHVQRDISNSHADGSFYRTVSRDTCGWCPYSRLCLNRFNPEFDGLPEGFGHAPSTEGKE